MENPNKISDTERLTLLEKALSDIMLVLETHNIPMHSVNLFMLNYDVSQEQIRELDSFFVQCNIRKKAPTFDEVRAKFERIMGTHYATVVIKELIQSYQQRGWNPYICIVCI